MRDQKIGLIVWSPLAAGLLSGRFREHDREDFLRRRGADFPPVDRERAWSCIGALRGIADARGVSMPQVALAWLLAQPHVTSVILGLSKL